MFKLFRKKTKTVKTIVYVRDKTPINNFDLFGIVIVLINCPIKHCDLGLHTEPFITTYQYDRLCRFNLGKYFQPVLLTYKTNNK